MSEPTTQVGRDLLRLSSWARTRILDIEREAYATGYEKRAVEDAFALAEARDDLAARIEERVRGTFAIRAVMDVTFDDLMVSQAAVLAAIREEAER